MDNLEPPSGPSNVPEFSVSELSFALKRQLDLRQLPVERERGSCTSTLAIHG